MGGSVLVAFCSSSVISKGFLFAEGSLLAKGSLSAKGFCEILFDDTINRLAKNTVNKASAPAGNIAAGPV